MAALGRPDRPAVVRWNHGCRPYPEEVIVTGWLPLIVMVVTVTGFLWLLGVRGAMLQLAGTALLLGAAGYAVQGQPGLAGSPRSVEQRAPPIPLTKLRHAFFGTFGPTEHWLVISESYASRGQTEEAAKALSAAVREHPGDPVLWVGLGNALTDHAGMLTPASQLAFSRAAELAPGHPAPPFFLGLALVRSGDPKDGVALWEKVLSDAPADASWRPLVEDAIRAVQTPQAATGS
jgi:cytochrome c-type biogenesis protein CcmH